MSFIGVFDGIKKNFHIKPGKISIDNIIFKLHYRATVLFLLVATVLVTSRQYVGEHIRCINDGGVANHVINTYCFFTTTFTVIKDMDAKMLDSGNLPHPGVGPFGLANDNPTQRHAYYQWVPFVLFGQAIMFYLTHMLWKKMEGSRIKILCNGLHNAAYALSNKEHTVGGEKIISKEKRDEKIRTIRNAFLERLYINGSWTKWLVFCEVLNFLHVILQIWITNEFLNKQFLNLGVDIWREGLESSVDVLEEVFPKVTKCTFHKYGPSGSIQLHDAMCVMALNIINEKIYTILWFWFIFLFIASLLGLIWRFATMIFHSRSRNFNRMVFANTCPGKLNPWDKLTVSKYCSYTDWLFLKYLSKNVDGLVFREIFTGLSEDIEERKYPSKEIYTDQDTLLKGKDE